MSETRTTVDTRAREMEADEVPLASTEFPNRREFTRVLVPMQAVATSDSNKVAQGHCRDVSMAGAHVRCDQPFELGAPCDCVLSWGASDELSIPVRAKVVRVDSSGMALEFTEMGMASYQHLQRLVLLNAEDADPLDAELDAHVGLKKRS